MKVDQPTLNAVPGAEVWPLSVAAYHVLGEAGLIPKRTELLYGFVYHKMPKSPFHSFLVTRLAGLVRKFLPAGWVMRTEQPITCYDSEPEPDVAVVGGKETDFRYEHPHTAELVIEMCVSSHEYDRSKIRAYASANLPNPSHRTPVDDSSALPCRDSRSKVRLRSKPRRATPGPSGRRRVLRASR